MVLVKFQYLCGELSCCIRDDLQMVMIMTDNQKSSADEQ